MVTALEGEVRGFEADFVSEHDRRPTDAEMEPVADVMARLKAVDRLEQLLVQVMADGVPPMRFRGLSSLDVTF